MESELETIIVRAREMKASIERRTGLPRAHAHDGPSQPASSNAQHGRNDNSGNDQRSVYLNLPHLSQALELESTRPSRREEDPELDDEPELLDLPSFHEAAVDLTLETSPHGAALTQALSVSVCPRVANVPRRKALEGFATTLVTDASKVARLVDRDLPTLPPAELRLLKKSIHWKVAGAFN